MTEPTPETPKKEFTGEETQVNQEETSNKPLKSMIISFRAASEQEYRDVCTIRDELVALGEGKSFRDLFMGALKFAQSQGYYLPEKK